MDIISTFYISNYSSQIDNARSKELETALLNNLASSYVNKIHLFVDNQQSLIRLKEITNSEKIVVIEVGKKPKFFDFFNYIYHNLNNNICMIINSDIFLLECDMNLIDRLKTHNLAYSLTRYEHNMSCPLINKYQGSHDCYIFNSAFMSKNILSSPHINYYQNFPGIETHILKALCDNGFKLLNPCYQIKIVHLHATDLRSHGQWIGLHRFGDDEGFRKECWCVPPVYL